MWGRRGARFPCCVCRGDHWSPVNLPPQRIFRDSFLVRQAGTGEQCSPLQIFFDSLSPKYSCPPHDSLPHRLRAEPPRRGGQERAVPRAEFSPFVGNVIRRGAFYMRPRRFILPQAGTGGYGIRPYVFETAEHQPSRDRVEVFLYGADLRRLRQALVQRQNAQGAKLQQQSHAQHGCKHPLAFIWSSLCIGNSRDGQSRPALRQCSYFLSFLRHNSTNSTAEHSASTSKSAGRAASPVCGIRNVGAVVCAGGVAGGISPAGVCALTGAGIVLPCSGVNRPLSSSCGTKGESKGKGSEFFHG